MMKFFRQFSMNWRPIFWLMLPALLYACAETPAQPEEHLSGFPQDSLFLPSEIVSWEETRFLCFRVEPENHILSIVNKSPDGQILSFSDLMDSTVLYIGNAGMYEKTRLAKGLLISDGHQTSPLDTTTSGYGNFYLQPNGVFWMDSAHHAHISPTKQMDEILQTEAVSQATQSGPILIQDSVINSLFGIDSPNRRTRNAVAINQAGQLLFVQSLAEVTFYELSSFLLSLGMPEALYLDGVVSRSWHRELEPHYFGATGETGPLIVIRDRATDQ